MVSQEMWNVAAGRTEADDALKAELDMLIMAANFGCQLGSHLPLVTSYRPVDPTQFAIFLSAGEDRRPGYAPPVQIAVVGNARLENPDAKVTTLTGKVQTVAELPIRNQLKLYNQRVTVASLGYVEAPELREKYLVVIDDPTPKIHKEITRLNFETGMSASGDQCISITLTGNPGFPAKFATEVPTDFDPACRNVLHVESRFVRKDQIGMSISGSISLRKSPTGWMVQIDEKNPCPVPTCDGTK